MRGDAIALLVIAAVLVGGLWFFFRATREKVKERPPLGQGDSASISPHVDGDP